jgi:hypothetical protein
VKLNPRGSTRCLRSWSGIHRIFGDSRCSPGLFWNHCPSLPCNPASQTESGGVSQGEFTGQKRVRVFTYAFVRIHRVFLLAHRHMHAYVASYSSVIHGVSRA